MRPLAVFDIDGVLADVAHRVHYVQSAHRNWDAFFAAATEDGVHEQGLQMAVEAARDCDLAFVTGRPERCRSQTLRWLRDSGIPSGTLAMRRTNDRGPASAVKLRLLRKVAQGRIVAVVVDDDLEVCRAYEKDGWPVLCASWAPRSATLARAQHDDGRT